MLFPFYRDLRGSESRGGLLKILQLITGVSGFTSPDSPASRPLGSTVHVCLPQMVVSSWRLELALITQHAEHGLLHTVREMSAGLCSVYDPWLCPITSLFWSLSLPSATKLYVGYNMEAQWSKWAFSEVDLQLPYTTPNAYFSVSFNRIIWILGSPLLLGPNLENLFVCQAGLQPPTPVHLSLVSAPAFYFNVWLPCSLSVFVFVPSTYFLATKGATILLAL